MKHKPERALILTKAIAHPQTIFTVEMKPQPERALIHYIEECLLFRIPRRNEAPAREGIDTYFPVQL